LLLIILALYVGGVKLKTPCNSNADDAIKKGNPD
jgi:hypothetical protein